MKLLMITGDKALAQGKKGPFYYMLEEFSKYWERIDIICPRVKSSANSADRRQPKIKNFHKNVFLHSSSWPLWRQPWFILKKGIEIYKKEKFDLFTVHSYPPFYNDIGGNWLYRKIQVPYILEIMHIIGFPKAGNFKEWFYEILIKFFINWDVKKAKAVRIVNKKQVPEFLKKTGINEKKLKYIPAFYIDLDIFRPQTLNKKYDLVFAGRLVKNKGIFLLLSAIKYIKQTKSRLARRSNQPSIAINLIIIGAGPLEEKIKRYIKKNKLEKNVEFAGWLPTTKDVAGIYNQSKIMVMPSFNEGGPRVTLEAMACEIPVITSKVGIMIDIIKHEENGLFIDWSVENIAEKILLLLGDEDLRKKIAENGYQTVQQFERKKAIKNYAESYKKLL